MIEASKRLVSGTAGKRGRNVFIHPGNSSMQQVSYGRIVLDQQESRVSFSNAGQETGLVCLTGECSATVGDQAFSLTAGDALYIPKGMSVDLATTSAVDLVECFAPVVGDYPVQYVSAESVHQNSKLHFIAGTDGAHREINILLGANINAGRLVVGITRSLPGNWTSWPPHEHAAMLEEIYVYVEMPGHSYGLQLVYEDDITPAAVEVVREGDAVLLPAGYHPNVAIPGSTLNFVWIMAAHREVEDRQWGVVNMDQRYVQ